MGRKARRPFRSARFLVPLIIFLSLFGILKAAYSQSLRLLMPNGGETWYIGENKYISWTSSGFSPDVKVELLLWQEGKGIIGTIVSNRSAGPGGQVVWTWKVGQYQGGMASPGSGYKIQIKTMDRRYADMSDRTFTLAQGPRPTITIINPTSSTVWFKGENQAIMWTTSGTMKPNVGIDLLDQNSRFVKKLISNTPNDGNESLTVPLDIAEGMYILRIDTYEGGIFGHSQPFKIEKRKPTMATPRHPSGVEKGSPPSGIVAPSELDLTVKDAYKNQYANKLVITYSTGNPKIGVVDKPLHFDVQVEAKYRKWPEEPFEETLQMVNCRTTLPATYVYLDVPLPLWPYYITGVDVRVTINPDKSIRETNYENNTKSFYIWQKDRGYFTFHPWPTLTRFPSDIFLSPWRNPPTIECDGCLYVFTQADVKDAIKRGTITYLPAVNGDMLDVPIKLAVARHCAEPRSTTFSIKYITYNGPRTLSGEIHFDDTNNVRVITSHLLLKIQHENFVEVWLGSGRRYRLNIRFDGLPWNLD